MHDWQHRVLAVTTVGILALTAAPAAVGTADTQGTLTASAESVVSGEPIAFDYATSEPHGTDWIGLYSADGGGPVDEEYVAPSLDWRYAPEAEGTLEFSTSSLEPGAYTAFYLARDGYAWLAEPVDFQVRPEGGTSFPVGEATLGNARVGDPYEARLGGLVTPSDAVFTRVGGDEWIDVAEDGTVSGTPDGAARDARVTVEAAGPDGSTARLTAVIPVRGSGQPLVDELGALSFNTWHGGTQVEGYHDKQLRFLLESGADIVGLQETQGRHAARLAEALGWYHWQGSGSLGVISRYPIVAEYGEVNASAGVRVALDGEDSQVNVWNVHLGYTPYGPYDACFERMDTDRILRREADSGRTGQITDTLEAMAGQLAAADEVPVLLLGDFNAPSHLDWTEELREKNCGYADVPWPTSVLPAEAGLRDTYRAANPDPVASPGVTWSPVYPFHEGSSGPAEPQDRIDFVYQAGSGLSVRESRDVVVGDPRPVPHHAGNEWTSDHAAVLTRFTVSG
ncbi:endonuclease/exonuclease/phosphatase family metal-dependent hydrolase [Nocardiopsis mwathae]|uniref:Endonuclease/exonuclease/phosphatase family metal-dependent hydrolase n=1 Tax=Nocardiopsis mwathae TaxID=1472723 RepID=A0A7W9YID1_9ACTN|nr:endonuclease/exonuclease/phosphatase family protein [Nocardiopsis mwathae]MBB6172718.1 endonuclease/exonuclease/phosphatase family metal-dependent hydrolase [Nocardiopsis mwathae]